MKSKISFFNSGLIKQDIKQHGWLGIVYLIGLIFAVPLQLIMLNNADSRRMVDLKTFFEMAMEIQAFFVFTIPILAGIFLFRYLQTKESVDMMHSLPIKRESLYMNHILSGFLLLIIPVWLTVVITAIVMNVIELPNTLTTSDLLWWGLIFSVFTFLTFIISVFSGMITGMSIAQGILTGIFLFLPVGLVSLVSYHLNIFLYGYSESFITGSRIDKLSPVIRIADIRFGDPFSSTELVVYLLLILLFAVFSYLLYKYRHLEAATQTIAFWQMRPIFKYGVGFCTLLVVGAYFASAQNHENGWLIFGYIVGATIGFYGAEMVLQKTWRIFSMKILKEFIGYTVVVVLLFVIVKTDAIGFETKVPSSDEIQGIYFGDSAYQLRDQMTNNKDIFSNDKNYIDNIRELHEYIASEQPSDDNAYSFFNRSMVIAYKLKNEDLLVREYVLPIDELDRYMKPVMEAPQYKYDRYNLQKLEESVDRITITPSAPTSKRVVIADPQEIKELKQILKTEILNETYEEMIDNRRSWASIHLLMPDNERINFEWRKGYTNLENWLAEKGYLSEARIFAEDIASIEIIEYTSKDRTESMHPFPEQIFSKAEPSQQAIEITKQEVIKEVLYQFSDYGIGTYYVKFMTVHGNHFYGMLTEKNVPLSVKELLEK